jgi:hypothetical protein
VKACVILHSFVRVRDGFRFEATLNIEGLEDLHCNTHNHARGPNATRDTFADYFQRMESCHGNTRKSGSEIKK